MNTVSVSRQVAAVVCSVALISSGATPPARSRAQSQESSTTEQATPKIPNDQLDSLVAPIALYPDPLLVQVLAASTYPLELMQLQQWLGKNKDVKDKALADAVSKQPWDPSVQAMAALPDVVNRLCDDIQWTTDLGNAFLAQQGDVMDAVQRMRKKAQETGNLKSNEQMKVETKVVESKQVVVIEQSNPQVVYVPSYNPTVVYGPPVYPYPPVTYPPPGYYAAGMAISFGVGVAMGAMWSGGWGWGAGWGHNNVNVNVNNNFNRNTNIQGGNRTNVKGGNRNTWQHNSAHRGGTPYADRGTANRYGGTARGDSMSNRQANAQQRQQQPGLNNVSNRTPGGAGDRGGNRAGTMDSNRGAGNRASAGSMDANRGGGDRGGNRASAGGMDSNRGGGDRVGNRSVSSGSNSGSRSGAFGGSSSGGASARASSSRGTSSMSGGARGGGSRGGGGGRRR